jgi:predicted DNA-binding transcriptional regulator AlpA
MNDRLLSYAGVKELTSLSESTIRRLVKAGNFPPPELLTVGRRVFHEAEVGQAIARFLEEHREKRV